MRATATISTLLLVVVIGGCGVGRSPTAGTSQGSKTRIAQPTPTQPPPSPCEAVLSTDDAEWMVGHRLSEPGISYTNHFTYDASNPPRACSWEPPDRNGDLEVAVVPARLWATTLPELDAESSLNPDIAANDLPADLVRRSQALVRHSGVRSNQAGCSLFHRMTQILYQSDFAEFDGAEGVVVEACIRGTFRAIIWYIDGIPFTPQTRSRVFEVLLRHLGSSALTTA